jgi:hypothetical protein
MDHPALRVAGISYPDMLELFLMLQQDTEVADTLFQQGGATVHYYCKVTSFLDSTFRNKWVG